MHIYACIHTCAYQDSHYETLLKEFHEYRDETNARLELLEKGLAAHQPSESKGNPPSVPNHSNEINTLEVQPPQLPAGKQPKKRKQVKQGSRRKSTPSLKAKTFEFQDSMWGIMRG